MKKGFSLTEILLGLAILGIIFSISIPMMATQRNQASKKAVFRETLNVLNDIMRQGMLNEELSAANFSTYFVSKMNALEVCQANAPGDCGPAASVYNTPSVFVTLPNGAIIQDIEIGSLCIVPGRCGDHIWIDWNGAKPPNQVGVDVLALMLAMGTVPWLGIEPGEIKVRSPDAVQDAASKQLHKEIYDIP